MKEHDQIQMRSSGGEGEGETPEEKKPLRRKKSVVYLVLGSILHPDSVVVPCDHGRGVGHYCAVENQCVAIVLLEYNLISELQISLWKLDRIEVRYEQQ